AGNETIARAAERAGYESEAAFNRAFKREFGMPPSAWRKSVREQEVDAAQILAGTPAAEAAPATATRSLGRPSAPRFVRASTSRCSKLPPSRGSAFASPRLASAYAPRP